MNETSEGYTEPASLRFLRRLVTVLTFTMIFGLLAILGLIVMRFWPTTTAKFPDTITLPSGKTAAAFTQTSDWYAIVTTDNEILIYSRSDNSLLQTIPIK